MKFSIQLYLLITLVITVPLNGEQSDCKVRLPESINSYQPSIQPVLRVDGKVIYFDRKLHPDNIAGTNDLDDIWFAETGELSDYPYANNFGKDYNTEQSDVLFSITPSGLALFYGTKNGISGGFSIAEIDSFGFKNFKPVQIKNFYNRSENFFAYLNHDASVLLLAINRNDTKGDLDIYVCFRENDGYNFSEPLNVGMKINTGGAEASPFLAYDDKTLYFSSNGRKGFGGKDLYVSRRIDDSWVNWSEPVNLGGKINTAKDENSIYLTALGDSAVISSWDEVSLREGLYTVCLDDSVQPTPYAIVTGKLTARDLILKNFDDIDIKVSYDNKPSIDVYKPRFNNNFYFVLPGETFSPIIIEKEGFEQFGFSVSTRNLVYPKYIYYNALLSKPKSNEIFLGKILFDYDSYLISKDWSDYLSQIDDRVLYPSDTKLIIVGHTDEKGPFAYNLKLSETRAEAVRDELLKYGFVKDKIRIVAKGKSEPESDNHEKNRRVEIYMIND